LNGEKFHSPLCKGSDSRGSLHLFEQVCSENSSVIEAINHLQSVPYSINYDYLDYHFNFSSLATDQKEYFEARALLAKARLAVNDFGTLESLGYSLKIAKLDSQYNFKDLLGASEIIGKYQQFKLTRSLAEKLRKEVGKAVLGVEKDFQDKFFIYLVRQLDYRGRIYDDCSLLTAFKPVRYALQDAVARPFDLNQFKVYCVKLELGSKKRLNYFESLEFFDRQLSTALKAFRGLIIFIYLPTIPWMF
jgi:hypothetical protein